MCILATCVCFCVFVCIKRVCAFVCVSVHVCLHVCVHILSAPNAVLIPLRTVVRSPSPSAKMPLSLLDPANERGKQIISPDYQIPLPLLTLCPSIRNCNNAITSPNWLKYCQYYCSSCELSLTLFLYSVLEFQ